MVQDIESNRKIPVTKLLIKHVINIHNKHATDNQSFNGGQEET